MSKLDRLMSHAFPQIRHVYSAKDTQLYALGCGAGADDLDLVYEPDLVALPSMAAVLAYPGNFYALPELGLDALRTLHGSERIELTGPLPVAGEVVATARIIAVQDKGVGRGAVVVSAREIRDAPTGALLATVTQRAICRGDGGLGSSGGMIHRPATIPDRPADRRVEIKTSPRAAAIYRLLGDDNPLHIDPVYARAAGFSRPILHGLATYGHIARALMRDAPGQAARIMDCRFTAPVFPGETLDLEVWDRPQGRAFRASIGSRRVIDAGELVLHGH